MSDQQPAPLPEGLVPYLDWPLYFRDDAVSCDQPACKPCGDDPYHFPHWRRGTARELLAEIKNHADAVAAEGSAHGGERDG